MNLSTNQIPVTLAVILTLILGCLCRDLTLEPGHLKPFGEGRPSQPIHETDGFLEPFDFFVNHIKPLRPLKMKGAAIMFPAFQKWTDKYFLASDEPSNHRVKVETKKEESRGQNKLDMSFKDFVKVYNTTPYYMINKVPDFISHDVFVPCPLQCKFITDNGLAKNVMWFSSGGTNSIVHIDSFNNINCLIRGNKTLVMVDPSKYRDKVDMDHPEGSYSDVNVDSVDYLQYPGLADVEFYHVNMKAGDCLYIPYKWIHQVRSFGSNLAVNVWWHHYLKDAIDFDACNTDCDKSLTYNKVNFNPSGGPMSPEEIRDHFMSLVSLSNPLDFARFVGKLLAGLTIEDIDNNPKVKSGLSQIFSLVDMDKDGILTLDELRDTPDETYKEVWNIMVYIDSTMGEDDPSHVEDEYHNQQGVQLDVDDFTLEYPSDAERAVENSDGQNIHLGDEEKNEHDGETLKHDEF